MISRKASLVLLLVITAAIVLACCLLPRFPQPLTYHQFADRRGLFGIPNFGDVFSNLPFAVIGVLGLAFLWQSKSKPDAGHFIDCREQLPYLFVFAGLLLTALGSSYYHLNPNNATLVWDRLPMAIVFMAFFSIVIAEHIDARAGRVLFYPLVAGAIASVIYWHFTEAAGHGDLRPYIIAQYLPMILVPLILLLFPSRSPQARFIWAVLGAYVLAKIFELADEEIFALTGSIGGHALKHLAAAFGVYMFLLAVRRRHAPA